jgi:hypothetical protein
MIKVTYEVWAYKPNKKDFIKSLETKVFDKIENFSNWVMCQDYHSINLTIFKDGIFYKIEPTDSVNPIEIRQSDRLSEDISYLTIYPDAKFTKIYMWEIQKIWIDDSLVLDITFGQKKIITNEFIKKIVKPLYGYFPADLINDEAGALGGTNGF